MSHYPDKQFSNEIPAKEDPSIQENQLPPISLSAIIHYAWGMTMALSSQDSQRVEAERVKEIFNNKLENQIDGNNIKAGIESFKDMIQNLSADVYSANAKEFLYEVSLYLSAIERSYGFEREVYIQNVNDITNWREHQTAYYESLATTMSTSIDSIAARILAFLGTGSLGALFGPVSGLVIPSSSDSNSTQNDIISSVPETANANRDIALNNLSGGGINEALNNVISDHNNLFLITFFLIAGSIGFVLASVIMKYYAHKKIEFIDKQYSENLQHFWKERMKPRLITMYHDLAKDLKVLVKRYNMKDDSLPDDDQQLRELIQKMLPDDETYIYLKH